SARGGPSHQYRRRISGCRGPPDLARLCAARISRAGHAAPDRRGWPGTDGRGRRTSLLPQVIRVSAPQDASEATSLAAEVAEGAHAPLTVSRAYPDPPDFAPSAVLQLAGINLLWGASSVAGKTALDAFGPFTLTALRFLPAGLLLLALTARGGSRPP